MVARRWAALRSGADPRLEAWRLAVDRQSEAWRLGVAPRWEAKPLEAVRRSVVWQLGAGQRLVVLLSEVARQPEVSQEVAPLLVARVVYCLDRQATAKHRT